MWHFKNCFCNIKIQHKCEGIFSTTPLSLCSTAIHSQVAREGDVGTVALHNLPHTLQPYVCSEGHVGSIGMGEEAPQGHPHPGAVPGTQPAWAEASRALGWRAPATSSPGQTVHPSSGCIPELLANCCRTPAEPAVPVMPATHPLLSWHRLTLTCTLTLQLLLPEHSGSSTPHAGESHNEEIWDFPLTVKCPPVPGQCQLPGLPITGITSGGGKGSSCSRVQHSQTIPWPHPGCAFISSHSSDQCSRPHHHEAAWFRASRLQPLQVPWDAITSLQVLTTPHSCVSCPKVLRGARRVQESDSRNGNQTGPRNTGAYTTSHTPQTPWNSPSLTPP